VSPRTTADRNRLIYTAFEAGRTLKELGKDYDLTEMRIRAILIDEGHKRIVSPEPFYREMRGGSICEA
jgi:Mor family transcriptional regulator